MNLSYVLLLILILQRYVFSLIVTTLRDVPEDALLNCAQLAVKYAGAVEEYDVVTEDGYMLRVYRLPGDVSRPVLLMHGIIGSSADYMLRGNTSLAFSLHRAGYDVWLGNVRGNRYSRRHIHLNPDLDRSFWDFSFHEHAVYDLASTIDHVLQTSGQEKLRLIGFSQGTIISFILLSTKPEYNSKIKVFVALAPVAFLNDLPSPMREIVQWRNAIFSYLSAAGIDEIASYYSPSRAAIVQMCFERSMAYQCLNSIIFPLCGIDPYEFEEEQVPVMFSHLLLGTTRKNLEHQGQVSFHRRFQQYDYGAAQNLAKYRSLEPTPYDLSKVIADTYILHADNDKLSTPKNVAILLRSLGNVIKTFKMPSPSASHMGFTQGRTEHKLVVKHVLDIFSKYNN